MLYKAQNKQSHVFGSHLIYSWLYLIASTLINCSTHIDQQHHSFCCQKMSCVVLYMHFVKETSFILFWLCCLLCLLITWF